MAATKKTTTTDTDTDTAAAAGAVDGQDLAAVVGQLVTRVDRLAADVAYHGRALGAVAVGVDQLRQLTHHPERHVGVLEDVPETV